MGSIGANKNTTQSRVVEESIAGTPLIFGTAVIRQNTIDIDGYSNKKTIEGALKDLAKAVDKYDKGEGDAIRSSIKFNEIVQTPAGGGDYILEWEEVPSATRYGENEEIEYKDAKWYLHTRIVKN